MAATNSPSSFPSSPPPPSSLAHFFSGMRLAPGARGAPSSPGRRGPSNAELAASPSAYPRSYDDHVVEVGQALGGSTLGHIHAGLQAAFIGRPVNRAVGDSAEAEAMNTTYLNETSQELGGAEEF